MQICVSRFHFSQRRKSNNNHQTNPAEEHAG